MFVESVKFKRICPVKGRFRPQRGSTLIRFGLEINPNKLQLIAVVKPDVLANFRCSIRILIDSLSRVWWTITAIRIFDRRIEFFRILQLKLKYFSNKMKCLTFF